MSWQPLIEEVSKTYPPTREGMQHAMQHILQLALCKSIKLCQDTGESLREEFGSVQISEGAESCAEALQGQLFLLRQTHGDFIGKSHGGLLQAAELDA